MRLTAFFILAAFSPLHGQAPTAPSAYTIVYTGRLLGYARTPDSQTLNVVPAAPVPNAVAQSYGDLFSGAGPATLRLGMGDNFAPALLARTFSMPAGASAPGDWCPANPALKIPKDRFFFNPAQHLWICDNGGGEDPNGHTAIDFDNVAQFFIDNKYAALVPGKHDFYYGIERLRDLARLMADHGVHMMALNLAVSTSRSQQALNAFPRVPARYATHPYKTEMDPVSVDLPDMVFPWKREFLIKSARSISTGSGLASAAALGKLQRKAVNVKDQLTEARVCHESGPATNGNPDQISLPGANAGNCELLLPAEIACASGRVLPHQASTCRKLYPGTGSFNALTDTAAPSTDEVFLFASASAELKAGLNHLFCVSLAAGKSGDWRCSPFTVQMPLFSWGAIPPPAGAVDLRQPFEVVSTGSSKVAVFGVVDPDLLSNVGLLNYAWVNLQHPRDTLTAVAPADYSLLQALELCNARDDCREASKVLMAQMPYAKAAQLAARLDSRFDAVISQADREHDTGDRDVETKIREGKNAAFVLTPAEPEEGQAFTPKVSVASVSRSAASWHLHHSVRSGAEYKDSAPGCGTPPCLTLSAAAGAAMATRAPAVAASGAVLSASPSATVQDLALFAMRKSLKTDIAFLQTRDFYRADELSGQWISYNETQNQLSRVLWKNDYAVRMHITGGTLRKIMKQSKKFGELDHDLLSTDSEKGRALVQLGLYNDPKDSDSWYVNGTAMDDGALYSVAVTPFIGQGDTGYSDLASPDVPPASRIEDYTGFRSVAGLVCAEIAGVPPYGSIPCDNPLLDARYFDPSSQVPADSTPGFNTATHYTTFLHRLKPPPDLPKTGAEGGAQQRSFFALNLENLDISYTGTYINHVAKAGTTFAGITASGVTTSGSNSIGADHKLRGIYDYRGGTFYLLSDSTFMRTSTSTALFPTIAANTVGFEGGGTLRLPLLYRPTWLSFQYSTRFEGQLTDPSPTQISGLVLDTPRASSIFGRVGLRIDHADTYIESGVEEVDSRHVLSKYAFTGAAGGAVYCQPSATSQLACGTDPKSGSPLNNVPLGMETSLQVPGLAKPTINSTDFLNRGVYLNFNVKFPLWSRRDANRADQSWYLILTNKGDFYFNNPRNDTTTQTRYLDKFTPGFSIPIYGKIMLTPKVDFLLYENKVNRNHFRSASPALSLSYSFNWREGMDWNRALRYGAITTAPSAAGTLH